MKTRVITNRGMALIETLAYIAVFFIVAGLALALFYRTEEQGRMLRRSADDITAVMNAGERWREDVRAAVAAPEAAGDVMRIRQRSGEVRYVVRNGALWREAGGRVARVLPQVQRSTFEKDARERVTAWRCTVELRKRRQSGAITPLFTFTAVPQTGGQR